MPVHPARRRPLLEALRARKVVSGLHGFVRAHAAFFYQEIERLGPRALPAGPEIWICGDCHTENVGAIRGDDDEPAIEINDFDEAVIGAPAHDVLRMALALAVLVRGAGLGGVDVRGVVEAMLAGYTRALGSGRVPPPPKRIRKLLRRAGAQTQRELLDRRAPRHRDGRRFALGERYWPLVRPEREAVAGLLADAGVVELLASLGRRKREPMVTLNDAAFRVAGTASLGCFRAAALIRRGAVDHDAALQLLDIKQALTSAAPRARGTPDDDAGRIVAGARAMAPALGARMVPAYLPGRLRDAVMVRGGRGGVIVRQLQPQEFKLSLAGLAADEAVAVGGYLGAVIGRAHRRQLSRGDARAWGRAVGDPAWLQRALPPLVGAHEEAYLAASLTPDRARRGPSRRAAR